MQFFAGLICWLSREHQWQDWHYLKEGSCERERLCLRCSRSEVSVKHAAWDYTEAGLERYCVRCRVAQRQCPVCGGTGETESWSSGDPAGGPHFGPTDYFKGRCDQCAGSGWVER